jgi:hypothetical protein
MESTIQTTGWAPYPVQFSVEYPDRDLNRLTFVLGVLRWANRVAAYAFVLVTDQYPPFRLNP